MNSSKDFFDRLQSDAEFVNEMQHEGRKLTVRA